MLLGYARVSTVAQDLTAQREARVALGVESRNVHVDHGLTGTNRARPALRPLIAALSSYGKQGRFYNLDLLAERPQTGAGPHEMWSNVEQVLIDHNDDLRAKRTAVTATDIAAQEAFIHSLEARTADSLERLWRLLAMAGVQGVLGDRGKGWGIDIAPDLVGRQIRS